MDVKKINKTKEHKFVEAWIKSIDDSSLVITSKVSGYSYKIDKLEKQNKLKFYNSVIAGWQLCTYLLPEEMFDMWYITAESEIMESTQ